MIMIIGSYFLMAKKVLVVQFSALEHGENVEALEHRTNVEAVEHGGKC